MILYKYLDPDRATDLLQSRLIRFTQPAAFNDPFDSRPCFDVTIERETVEQICQLDDPEETKKWQAQVLELLQGPELKEWYTSGMLRNIAILCLVENPDNILMWAHYARSHQGFVVGFDVEHPSLRFLPEGSARTCQKVTYTPDRPKRETLTDLTAEEAFYTKSPDWQYEREWRIFDGISQAARTVTGGGESIYLFRFDPRAVREVVLGARMREDSAKLLTRSLKDQDYRHVRLMKAELDPEQYRLNIRDVPFND